MMNADVSIATLIQTISQELSRKYQNELLCTQYAWWVLEAITQKNKATLLAHDSIALTPEQKDTLKNWIDKQVEDNIPLQYLIGSVPFASCDILVEPPTLIPRQETEEWCVSIIEQLKQLGDQPLHILDLCTGSGCIALSLAKELPHAQIYASDISDTALALAQKNAAHNNLKSIQFLSSDLLYDIPKKLQFDIIISNPPYISSQEWQEVDASVKEWEDPIALLASDEGLGVVKQLITQAKTHLKPHAELQKYGIPQLIIEIGYQQGAAVKALFEKEGFCNVIVKKDMYSQDRIVVGCITNDGSPRES
jgi:release factor glutamine methyltransferase